MSGLRLFFIYTVFASSICFFISCAESTGPEEGEEEVVEVGADAVTEDLVYHQVPSPGEMMEFVKSSGGGFKKELLCNTEIHNRYVDLKGKSIGMGIYIADLAYATSFSQFQESNTYLKVVVKMAEDIGISEAFDNNMLERIAENLDNADSLESISDDSYYEIIAELEENDRGKIVAMIAAGGFLESLFITTQLVGKFDAKNPIMERIASQKLTYENVMAYLEKYKEDQNVEWTINDMMVLKGIFEEISDNRRDTKFTEGKGGKKVLGGEGGVYITEMEFEDLREKVAYLRNTITFNSPQPQ